MMKTEAPRQPAIQTGVLYCPICTRYVDGDVRALATKKMQVVPGQKCPRCASSLDAAIVVQVRQAA